MARPKVDSVQIVVSIPRGLHELIESAASLGFMGSTPAEVARTLMMQGVENNKVLGDLAKARVNALVAVGTLSEKPAGKSGRS